MLNCVSGSSIFIGSEEDPVQPAHEFRTEDMDAVNAALAARRPLLLRGEPGVGKTQLAVASAVALGFGYVHCVVDANTEARDLRWTEDLVDRLADAQLAGTPGPERHKVGEYLDYVEPGPLWWAFSWDTAAEQSARRNKLERTDAPTPFQPDPRCDPARGVVVLIDEIDKAEPELPNGLLEALGARQFSVKGRRVPIVAENWPLVIVTTNEARVLPDAFLRRCLVHEMEVPDLDSLEGFLVGRGKQHFPDAPDDLLKEIAKQTVADRREATRQGLSPRPGQAEFLDFVRAAIDLNADEETLVRIAPFFLKKHLELRS